VFKSKKGGGILGDIVLLIIGFIAGTIFGSLVLNLILRRLGL